MQQMPNDDIDWSELEDIEDSVLRENAESKEAYGQRYNQYNPEFHIGCFVDGISTMQELSDALDMLKDHVAYMQERGWEMAEPISEGMIMTYWIGEGSPPLEDSQFDETGYDLDGNCIDDWYEGEEK